jgi:hypothetical protein
MQYSPSTGGFYHPELHGEHIPADAVEITPQLHASLLAGQAAGRVIVAGPAGVPMLADAVPVAPTQEQREAAAGTLIQSHLDAQAQALGYESIATAVTYADEPAVPRFQIEGQALRAWRSVVWATGYQLLDAVKAGTRPEPTDAELLALLPVFVPPAIPATTPE